MEEEEKEKKEIIAARHLCGICEAWRRGRLGRKEGGGA